MHIHASAPGKLLLLGEYAVLHGAPALVMAVNRRARVSLEPATSFSVSAPHMETDEAEFTLDGDGQPQWRDPQAAERFHLMDHILRRRAGRPLPRPFRTVLDTNDFFERSGKDTHKLGLGSSAALTVAAAGALSTWAGDEEPGEDKGFPALLETHRALQGGQGSGFDVAAALYGGIIGFRLAGTAAEIESLTLPASMRTLCVWSGKSASTGGLVGRVSAWRERDPRTAAALFDAMSETALAGLEATRSGHAGTLLDTLDRYADLLVRLGESSGTDIVCREHQEIRRIAAGAGAVYKSCGAGGGDVGMVFSDNAACIEDLHKILESRGFAVVPLCEDEAGLQVVTKE